MDYPDGRLFALLQLKLDGESPADLSEEDRAKIEELERKLKSQSTETLWKKVAKGLPNRECKDENEFFAREDICLGLMFHGFKDSDEDRNRYFQHMNTCFYCFELYSDVMRGYLSELEKHKNR